MPLPFAALPLGGALLAALTTDAAAGGRVDAMAGVAPVRASGSSEPSVGGIVTPLAALRLAEPDWQMSLRYFPRFLWRTPNDLDQNRPLLLNRGVFDATVLPGPSLKLRSTVRGSAGQIDYIGYALQSNPSASSPPTGAAAPGTVTPPVTGATQPPSSPAGLNLAVISLYDVSADVSLEAQATERTTLLFPVTVGKSASLDKASNSYPPHTYAAFAPEVRRQLTQSDDGRAVASIEYHKVTQTDFLAPSAEVGWTHHSSARASMSFDAGLQYLKTLHDAQPGKLRPIVEAVGTRTLVESRQTRLVGTLGVSLRNVLYVITADYRPIAAIQGGLDLVVAPRWTAGLRGSFATTATREPVVVGDPETYFLAEAPVRYAANKNVVLEVGLRSLWSAPHFSETFVVEQFQFWGYGAVSVLFGTTPNPEDVIK